MSIYIKRLDVVDSTNRYVRDEAVALWRERCGCDAVAVTAMHQTAGRGQRGNVWQSQSGCNLLMSILVRPGKVLEVKNQFLLSQLVAVSIHTAMKCYGIDTRLKWPNDIYVGNRKLAGVLIELDYSDIFVEQAIIGVGINVNQEQFLPMDRNPVSMKMLLGCYLSIDEILTAMLDSFETYYARLCCGNSKMITDEYSRLLIGLNERRTFVDATGKFEAVIEGVEYDGHLLVRRSDGVLSRYAFKEIEQNL